MKPRRGTVPIVAGLLAAAAAVPFVIGRFSPVRQVSLDLDSGRLFLDIPKLWDETGSTVVPGGRLVYLFQGALSGAHGFVACQLRPLPTGDIATEPRDFLRETWTEDGVRYTLVGRINGEGLGVMGWGGFELSVENARHRVQIYFVIVIDVFEQHRPLLERCARSVRWVGR